VPAGASGTRKVLELRPEEAAFVELKLAPARFLRDVRVLLGLGATCDRVGEVIARAA
jgi:hypothetical protein